MLEAKELSARLAEEILDLVKQHHPTLSSADTLEAIDQVIRSLKTERIAAEVASVHVDRLTRDIDRLIASFERKFG